MRKKLALFLILATIGLVLDVFGLSAMPTRQNIKVLLILREYSENLDLMLTKEAIVMKSTMEKSGLTVVVATASGRPLKGRSVTLVPDQALSQVVAADYEGVIIACMAAGVLPGEHMESADEIVKTLFAKGKPVAAQNGAVSILGRAGVLKGKKYAMEGNYVGDGIYSGIGVVRDGNVVTSGTCPFMARPDKPDGTLSLTNAFVDMVLESVKK